MSILMNVEGGPIYIATCISSTMKNDPTIKAGSNLKNGLLNTSFYQRLINNFPDCRHHTDYRKM